MILNFSNDHDSLLHYANLKNDEGDYNAAFHYVLDALSFKEDGETLFTLAKTYYGLAQYDFCLDICFKILALNYVIESKSALTALIVDAMSKLGMRMKALYYTFRSDLARDKIDLDEELLREMVREIVEDGMDGLPVPSNLKFAFADEAREAYNEETLTRAVQLAEEDDVQGALKLLDSLYEDSHGYSEGRYLSAHFNLMGGNDEKAADIYLEMCEKEPMNGNYLYDLSLCGQEHAPYVYRLLSEFDPQKGINVPQAIFAAINLKAYEQAERLAVGLSDSQPTNRYFKMLKHICLWNSEKYDAANDVLSDVVNSAPFYYPLEMLEKISFPYKYTMPFLMFPLELSSEIGRKVSQTRTFSRSLDKEDFRIAVAFSLCTIDNYAYKSAILKKLARATVQGAIDVLCRVLHSFHCIDEIRRDALMILLEKGALNSCGIVVGDIFVRISLVLPDHYGEYAEPLKTAYKEAFSHLAFVCSDFEDDLHYVAETLHSKYDIVENLPLIKKELKDLMIMYYLKKSEFSGVREYLSSSGVDYVGLLKIYDTFLDLFFSE